MYINNIKFTIKLVLFCFFEKKKTPLFLSFFSPFFF